MTNIYLEKDGNKFTVDCRGHADSEAGCASVSILCYTLVGFLLNVDDCEIETERMESGEARIVFYAGEDSEALIAFDVICLGFFQLADSYPNTASVEFTEIA